jgi:hypothetical protein
MKKARGKKTNKKTNRIVKNGKDVSTFVSLSKTNTEESIDTFVLIDNPATTMSHTDATRSCHQQGTLFVK